MNLSDPYELPRFDISRVTSAPLPLAPIGMNRAIWNGDNSLNEDYEDAKEQIKYSN